MSLKIYIIKVYCPCDLSCFSASKTILSLSRVFKGSIATAKSVGTFREHHTTALLTFETKIIEKIKVKFFWKIKFFGNFWFFGKKNYLSGYFLWQILLIISPEHLPIKFFFEISTVATVCRLIYFRASKGHVFPCLQFCVHIFWFFKAKRLETKLITPYLHLKVIPRLSFWLKIEVFANLRIFSFSWVF